MIKVKVSRTQICVKDNYGNWHKAAPSVIAHGATFTPAEAQGAEVGQAYDLHGNAMTDVLASRTIMAYSAAVRENKAAETILELLTPGEIAAAVARMQQYARTWWAYDNNARRYAAYVDRKIVSLHDSSNPAGEAALAEVGLAWNDIVM